MRKQPDTSPSYQVRGLWKENIHGERDPTMRQAPQASPYQQKEIPTNADTDH